MSENKENTGSGQLLLRPPQAVLEKVLEDNCDEIKLCKRKVSVNESASLLLSLGLQYKQILKSKKKEAVK